MEKHIPTTSAGSTNALCRFVKGSSCTATGGDGATTTSRVVHSILFVADFISAHDQFNEGTLVLVTAVSVGHTVARSRLHYCQHWWGCASGGRSGMQHLRVCRPYYACTAVLGSSGTHGLARRRFVGSLCGRAPAPGRSQHLNNAHWGSPYSCWIALTFEADPRTSIVESAALSACELPLSLLALSPLLQKLPTWRPMGRWKTGLPWRSGGGPSVNGATHPFNRHRPHRARGSADGIIWKRMAFKQPSSTSFWSHSTCGSVWRRLVAKSAAHLFELWRSYTSWVGTPIGPVQYSRWSCNLGGCIRPRYHGCLLDLVQGVVCNPPLPLSAAFRAVGGRLEAMRACVDVTRHSIRAPRNAGRRAAANGCAQPVPARARRRMDASPAGGFAAPPTITLLALAQRLARRSCCDCPLRSDGTIIRLTHGPIAPRDHCASLLGRPRRMRDLPLSAVRPHALCSPIEISSITSCAPHLTPLLRRPTRQSCCSDTFAHSSQYFFLVAETGHGYTAQFIARCRRGRPGDWQMLWRSRTLHGDLFSHSTCTIHFARATFDFDYACIASGRWALRSRWRRRWSWPQTTPRRVHSHAEDLHQLPLQVTWHAANNSSPHVRARAHPGTLVLETSRPDLGELVLQMQ